ncbi:hypothetical protein CAPN006_21480 [Capnocytophaga canimorsus]|nr:hypothetical protein CAPN006_21480 [Capnocytophaga canimorsus]
MVSPIGEVTFDKAEPIENLITWVYENGSFVPIGKLTENESFSIVSDYIGRPVLAFNENGKKVWSCDYDIYGRVHKETLHPSLGGAGGGFIPFRQLGQYEDCETGLYYNRFRYYDCNTGTYISQDPIGLLGNNPNFYAYVFDSNTQVDVFGLDCNRVTNPLPKNNIYARVMPKKYAEAFKNGMGNLGGGKEVFVTAFADLKNIKTRKGAQKRLALFKDENATVPNLDGDVIVKFEVSDINKVGVTSPIETIPNRGYGFKHGGRTGGGAREWLFNNGTSNELGISNIELINLK